MKQEKLATYHLHKAHPEKLQFEVYDLNEYRKRSGEMASHPHSHSYYQIIWFYKEGGTHVVDFKCFDIKKNTLLFISKDQIHAFDENLSVEGRLIHFNESFFMHNDVDIFLKYQLFRSTQNPCYALPSDKIAIATSYLQLIEKELQHRDAFGTEDVIRFLLKSFLITLERQHRGDASKKIALNSTYELQYYQFKELLEIHYMKGLSVQSYAKLLHISSKTLTTITQSIVGKPPSILISERVILAAKRLLKFTSLQVGEVAFKIGFEDASYFVKYFKKHTGMTPILFRNSIK